MFDMYFFIEYKVNLFVSGSSGLWLLRWLMLHFTNLKGSQRKSSKLKWHLMKAIICKKYQKSCSQDVLGTVLDYALLHQHIFILHNF